MKTTLTIMLWLDTMVAAGGMSRGTADGVIEKLIQEMIP